MSFDRFVVRYTVTTVLIFALWDKRMPMFRYRGFEHLRFPFLQIAEMHGFINAFLGLEQLDPKHIQALFHKDAALAPWQPHVIAQTFSINEAMIACKDFRQISYQDDEHIVYEFEIPDKFDSDVQNIMAGRYNMGSDRLLRNVFIAEPEIPQENTLMTSLIADNIPYHIMKRSDIMAGIIEDALGSKPQKSAEYFKKFQEKNEVLIPEKHLVNKLKIKIKSNTENEQADE